MKKYIFLLGFLLIPSLVFAQSKATALTELTAPISTDVVYVVDDPGGTPLSKKVTVGNLIKGMASTNLSDTADLLYETELDTEAELEAQMTDMANVIQATEIDTFAEVDAIVADKALVNKADGAVWLGTHDYGGATLEIPNTVVGSLPAATAGRLAIVTDGADADDCTTGSGSTVVLCMANGATWEPTGDSGSGGGSPGGSDGQVQYNNGGAFGGEAELFWDDANNRLGIGDSTPSYALDVNGTGQITGALILGSTLGVTELATLTKGAVINNGRDTTTSGDFLVQGGGITDLIFADASANDVIIDGDLVIPLGTSCADTVEGSICWDSDDDTLYVGDGSTVTAISGGGSGDITDVYNCSTGDCAAIVMGASDSLDAGAGVLEIPNGTAPTVDATGEIALDTTDNQLVVYDGSAVAVYPQTHYRTAVIENLAAADDDLEIFMANDAVTITSIGVHCAGTCTTGADISLEDRSGNAMTHTTPTHSTGTSNTTFQSVTAANSLVAGEGLRIDVDNAVDPETDTYTITVGYTFDRQ